MDWQQLVSLSIVAIAALLFVRGWARRKRCSRAGCSSCSCPTSAVGLSGRQPRQRLDSPF